MASDHICTRTIPKYHIPGKKQFISRPIVNGDRSKTEKNHFQREGNTIHHHIARMSACMLGNIVFLMIFVLCDLQPLALWINCSFKIFTFAVLLPEF